MRGRHVIVIIFDAIHCSPISDIFICPSIKKADTVPVLKVEISLVKVTLPGQYLAVKPCCTKLEFHSQAANRSEALEQVGTISYHISCKLCSGFIQELQGEESCKNQG